MCGPNGHASVPSPAGQIVNPADRPNLAPSPTFGFRCRQCGNCCRAPGAVRLRLGEPELLAQSLGLDVYTFNTRYTRLASNRRELVLCEQAGGACVFLNAANRCEVHDAKPAQCRDYPMGWQHPGLDRHCAARQNRMAGPLPSTNHENTR